MHAVQVVAPGKIQFVEIERPVLPPGHVIVRPRYLSLCGSNVHMVYYGHPHEYPVAVGSSGHLSTKQALQMIATGEIDVEPQITHTFSFDRVMDAYELAHSRGDNCIKILVEIPGRA